ncbi:MAG: ABC transporter permease [Mediterraneibacter gnavus]
MTSGRWLESSSKSGSRLEIVVNKKAQKYFAESSYAAGNVKNTLALTPFNIVGVVNDGRDLPTVYVDSMAMLYFTPAMWQVQSANIYWHSTTGLTTEQIHSAVNDILADSIGGHVENAGRSDVGNTYDSVLSILQLGLLVTSLLLLFVSVLGQINIGLSSLEQRTHELLIRRAIGASRTNIVTLVLGSQLILSIFVCFAAILISLILVHCIGILLPVDSPVGIPSYPISVAIIAVTVSMLTALCGGLLPALKAAKLEPALALR